jgi:hypothetical protein
MARLSLGGGPSYGGATIRVSGLISSCEGCAQTEVASPASALLIVGGEAWLFLSVALLLCGAALAALAFHLLVVGYEEPRLRVRFGSGMGSCAIAAI